MMAANIRVLYQQYIFYNKDPRRVQPLMDYLIEEFKNTDYNGESSFDAIKILSLFRSLYQELNWKFSAWIDEVVEHCWPEISGEHEDVGRRIVSRDYRSADMQVRSCVGEILAFSSKIKVWRNDSRAMHDLTPLPPSGDLDQASLPQKSLSGSAAWFLLTTISWEFVENII
jgi:hypothetical protein